MNMISQLRQRVRNNGKAEITAEEFDRLHAEWVTRAGAEDMVDSERERCLRIVRNGCGDSLIEAALTEAIINGDPE